jgi:O-antigen/teichoic acid export membrane protein
MTDTLVPTAPQASGPAARRGAMLGMGTQMSKQVLSVLATVVLARLLTPADFGIVAAVNTLMGLAVIGTTLGFAPAVIRRLHLDETFVSTLFWSSLGVSASLGLVLIAAAPWLAGMFGRPEAAAYVAVMVPALVCDVCASIPLAMLQRDLRFAALYGSILVAMVVYVVVQIVLALAGFGAWSVIIGQVAMSTTSLVLALALTRWLPKRRFARGVVRSELGFAGGIFASQVLSYGLKSADYWVVGRTLGGAALGAYYIAFQLPSIVRLRMSNVSRQVLFPVFAQERQSEERVASIYLKAMRLQIGLGLPTMIGLAALAAPITAVFFGDQWEAAVEPTRWLALAAVFEIVTSPAGSIAIAHGRLRPFLASLGVRLALMLAVLMVAAQVGHGLEAFAVAMLVQSVGGAVITQVMVAQPLGLPAAAVVRPLAISMVPAVLMYVAVQEVLRFLPTGVPDVVALLLGVPVGILVHVVALYGVSRSEASFLRRQSAALGRSLTGRRRPRGRHAA